MNHLKIFYALHLMILLVLVFVLGALLLHPKEQPNIVTINSYQFTEPDVVTKLAKIGEVGAASKDCDTFEVPDLGTIPEPPLDELNKPSAKDSKVRDVIVLNYTKELLSYIDRLNYRANNAIRAHMLRCDEKPIAPTPLKNTQ